MKKITSTIALLFMMIVFNGCNNDDDQPIIPTPAPAADGFTWKENGSATSNTATTATFSTQYKTLIAKDASNATLFEINLSGTAPATYTVDANNAITYAAVNPYFTATSGSIVISANASGKVTGTFQATGNAAGITAITGTFTNITVVP